MHGELVVVDDAPAEFAERVIEAYHGRPNDGFSIALSGGDTARSCYERLADDAGNQIDWWAVDVYWGDERCVPLDHEDSNYRLGREALLEKVGAVNANYPMRCEEGADPYQLRIGELGRLDVVHLGLGPDGHTASLFPGSPALEADPGRLVVMNEDPSGRNVHPRMTAFLISVNPPYFTQVARSCPFIGPRMALLLVSENWIVSSTENGPSSLNDAVTDALPAPVFSTSR